MRSFVDGFFLFFSSSLFLIWGKSHKAISTVKKIEREREGEK